VFRPDDVPFPKETLRLTPEGTPLKIGNEVGWVGFPGIASGQLCFFAGRVSAWLESERSYLINGVAVNGVSGGPTFFVVGPVVVIMGAVSAYRTNRATGEALPGLCEVTHVAQFHDVINTFKSLEEAKQQESPPSVPSPPEENAQANSQQRVGEDAQEATPLSI
jgi:hypothetical protein